MNRFRFIALLGLFAFGALLIFILQNRRPVEKLKLTLAPAFQIAGRIPQSVDELLSKVIPVSALDERMLGEALIRQFPRDYFVASSDPAVIYLNALIEELRKFSHKPFEYRVHLTEQPVPNACALPGGHIVVHRGLLVAMKSEAELLSVLAHEMAHIELEHCFQAVKYELLSRKITGSSLAKIADIAMAILIRHSFSKTVEGEADEYAFSAIKRSVYDPRAVGNAFRSLDTASQAHGWRPEERKRVDILRDYFTSHPPIKLRILKFSEAATAWWLVQPKELRRYIGNRNLEESTPYSLKPYEEEWAGFRCRL